MQDKKTLLERLVLLITIVLPVWGLVYQAGKDSEVLAAVAKETEVLAQDVKDIKLNQYQQQIDTARIEQRTKALEREVYNGSFPNPSRQRTD